jgi:hypothetical protein
MRKHRLRSTALTMVTAFSLSAGDACVAHSEPAFCLSRVNAYVKELDAILVVAKYSLTPIDELNQRSFPFVDCDPDALVGAVSRSLFFRRVTYSRLGRDYLIEFASDDLVVTFSYKVDERVSFLPCSGWVNK